MSIKTVGINTPSGSGLNEKIRQAFLESYEKSAELNARGGSDPVANREEVISEMSEKISQAIDDYIKSITVTVTIPPGGVSVIVTGTAGKNALPITASSD